MMNWKTNPHKLFVKASTTLLTLIFYIEGASALNAFQCLRDIMDVTSRSSLQMKRKQVEEPFVSNGKFLVFPFIEKGRVSGFYVYDSTSAYYYDLVDGALLRDLKPSRQDGILEMVAQPNGIDTVTIWYLPEFDPRETNRSGPVALGSSVLPVVGAFVSRPSPIRISYFNPLTAEKKELRQWLNHRTQARDIAKANDAEELSRTIRKLGTSRKMDEKELWRPLLDEVRIRKEWIQSHNLDSESFRPVARAIAGPCR